MNEKVVIIGSGAVAVAAIKAIREVNHESKIVVFGEEKFYPYYRIKISKGLLSGLEEEKILIQNKKWYIDNNIELHLDKKVLKIVPEESVIVLQDGSSITYSKLLLANGASNITPSIKGINKTGVFTLRSLDGAYKIINYIKDSEKILLIGGGIQNLEVANILSKNGKKVIVAEFASRLMPRQLDDFASNWLRESIESQGIEILLNTQIQEIIGEDKVTGYSTQSGILGSCDMVIYSTGIISNTEITQGTEIEIGKGIKVNDRMTTNIPNIFAAGDVSEFNNRVYGLWSIATQQGKIAGANMCNRDLTFEIPVTATTIDAFGLSIFSMGDIEESSVTDQLIEVDKENSKYTKIIIQDNHIIGAIIIGDSKKSMLLKKHIEIKTEVNFNKSNKLSLDEFIQMLKNTK